MTTLQIRHVPDELAARIRLRAKHRHVSISRHLLALAEEDLATAPLDDWLDDVARQPSRMAPGTDIDALVREGRADH